MSTAWFKLAALAFLILGGCSSQVVKRPEPGPVALVAAQAASAAVVVVAPVLSAANPAPGLKPLTPGQVRSQEVRSLSTPKDIWDRIQRGFAISDLDSDLVHERELWYSSRPDYVDRMTERGRKYLFYIVEELERRNMPTELALLPFVESAFNPQATSRAKATGIWQFMPATGRNFDLKQNMFRDDRRDVLASTRAALDYFQRLYDMFGDWQLALAAYNWGEGNVLRVVTRARKSGTSTAYADLPMPMETRMYIPKLQAIKNIIAHPENFRITLPDIQNHPYFQAVDIKRDIDVSVAASLAEISVGDFLSLNPSCNKPVLLAAGNSQILLPWDNAERFQSNLEAFTGDRLASWTAWVAPTTLKVSEAARRVGMSETELRSVNHIPPRMQIRTGSTLVIRRSENVRRDISEHIADNGYLALAPEVVLRKTLVKARKNDTVTTLAQRYKVSPRQVVEWNQVSPNAGFKRGQKVVVYLPCRQTAKSKAPSPRSRHKKSKRSSHR